MSISWSGAKSIKKKYHLASLKRFFFAEKKSWQILVCSAQLSGTMPSFRKVHPIPRSQHHQKLCVLWICHQTLFVLRICNQQTFVLRIGRKNFLYLEFAIKNFLFFLCHNFLFVLRICRQQKIRPTPILTMWCFYIGRCSAQMLSFYFRALLRQGWAC